MDSTIVVAVAIRTSEQAGTAEPVLARMLTLGGTLVGWSGQEFAVGFARTALIAETRGDSIAGDGAEVPALDAHSAAGMPAWLHALAVVAGVVGDDLSVAVCRGPVGRSAVATDHGTLGVGRVIARALALSATVRRREAWIERELADLPEVEGWLRPLGERARLFRGKPVQLVRIPLRGGVLRAADRIGVGGAVRVPVAPGSHADAKLGAVLPASVRFAQGQAPLRVSESGQHWLLASAELPDARAELAQPYVIEIPLAVQDPARGKLTLVRADPGAGGTRALSAAAAARVGVVSVAVCGLGRGVEPFGSLRVALGMSGAESPAAAHAGVVSPSRELHRTEHAALQAASGVTLDAAVRLLQAACGPGGVIHLQGLRALDSASLRAVVLLCTDPRPEVAVAVVAHLDALEPVPAALAGLPLAATWDVPPLADSERATLVRALVPRDFDARLVSRLGRRRLPVLALWACVRTFVEQGRWTTQDSLTANVAAHLQPWLLAASEVLAIVAHAPALLTRAEVLALATSLGARGPHAALGSLLRAGIFVSTATGTLLFASDTYAETALRELELAHVERALRVVAAHIDDRMQGLARMHAADLWARTGESARSAALALEVAKLATQLALDPTPLLQFASEHLDDAPAEAVLRMVSSLPPRTSVQDAATDARSSAPPTLAELALAAAEATDALLSLQPEGWAHAGPTSRPPHLFAPNAEDARAAGADGLLHDVVARRAAQEAETPEPRQVREMLLRSLTGALRAHDGPELERTCRALRALGVPESHALFADGLAKAALGHLSGALAALRDLADGAAAAADGQARVAARARIASIEVCARAGRHDEALAVALGALARARHEGDAEASAAIAGIIERIGQALADSAA